ncbi:MAG: hypothetical protein ABSH11_02100 [Verrucomicrobiota bacterium]|jgi:hypothetical protein
MKKCTYCGKEYPDEASECVIDGQPLASFPPEPELTDGDLHDEAKIVTIRTFGSHEAAEVAVANLEAHGIACWVKTDDCGGMYPNLTVAGGVRLLVCAADAEAAIALLNAQVSPAEINQVETEAVSFPPPETVPPKRLAWGQILFGIVVGIILCLVYQWANKLGTQTHYHYTKDGKCDEAWVYRNGHLIEFLQDRNHDGQWDHWTYYENGRRVRSEYDNNFDGKPDDFWAFLNDGTDTSQRDTDFNGTPDWFCTYKNDIIQQADMRPNGSKFTTTREIFHNGVLTEIWRGGDSNGNFKEVVRYDPFFNPISTNMTAF